MSRSATQLNTVYNAFAANNRDPKLPDGKCITSLGTMNTQIGSVIAGEDTMDILLYPGLMSGCYISNVADKGPTTGEAGPQILKYDNHHNIQAVYTPGTDGNPDFPERVVTPNGNKLTNWRIVSQALKITHLNDSEDDSGWFEAIKFNPSADVEKWECGSLNNLTTNGIRPREDLFNLVGQGLVDKPNYIAGKLRNIGKLNFFLSCYNNSHDFVPYDNDITVDTDKPEADPLLINQFWDANMDCVLIRVHGRKDPVGATNDCCRGTKLLLHLRSMQELIHHTDAPLAKHMTKCYKNDMLCKVYEAHQANQAPYLKRNTFTAGSTTKRPSTSKSKKTYKKRKTYKRKY